MRYRYDGHIEVKVAGRTWTPGETFDTHHKINNPHFHPVEAKPRRPLPAIPKEDSLDGNDN